MRKEQVISTTNNNQMEEKGMKIHRGPGVFGRAYSSFSWHLL